MCGLNRSATMSTWVAALLVAAGGLTTFRCYALPETGAAFLENWRLVRDDDGIRVFHRTARGSAIPEARADATIASPPSRVYAAISDYDNFAEFVPYVVGSKIVRQKDHFFWVYQRLRFPWPIADRRFVIQATHDVDRSNPGFYTVRWRMAEPETLGLVQEPGIAPTIFAGSWELRPLNGGSMTRATYAVHLDPGGVLPAWLVKIATDDLLPNVVRAIRQRALSQSDGNIPLHVESRSR